MGYKPREFAGQMNLNINNGWGIVRTIVDLIRSHDNEEEGDEETVKKYILVKDPNKPVLRLYGVPSNTFEEDEDMGQGRDGKIDEEDE